MESEEGTTKKFYEKFSPIRRKSCSSYIKQNVKSIFLYLFLTTLDDPASILDKNSE